MIVTIHQPEHMPWSGFFHKMMNADVYVILDTVQFKKNNWQNRNRIIDRNGNEQWLTVPVSLKGHLSNTINDIEIPDQRDWRKSYWGRIKSNYSKHTFFPAYENTLYEIIYKPRKYLVDFNLDLINFFRSELDIETKIIRNSELGVTGKKTDLLVGIVRETGGDQYLSGPDGKSYLELPTFHNAGVEVTYQDFSPPVYQSSNGYIPGLSVLDIFLNYGKDTRDFLEN